MMRKQDTSSISMEMNPSRTMLTDRGTAINVNIPVTSKKALWITYKVPELKKPGVRGMIAKGSNPNPDTTQ